MLRVLAARSVVKISRSGLTYRAAYSFRVKKARFDMEKFLNEVRELVEQGEGERMIEISVLDLFRILSDIVYAGEVMRQARDERRAMERALDGLLYRVGALENGVEYLEWEVRELT